MSGNNDNNDNDNTVDLNELYTQISVEEPSPETDNMILAHAKSQLNKPSVHPTSPKTWRKWQWPTSIAASVMFVSVIVYTQYEQFDPQQAQPNSQPVNPYAIAEVSTLDEERAKTREILETKTQREKQQRKVKTLANNADLGAKMMDITGEPAPSNYAENEAAKLASRALDGVELDIDMNLFSPSEEVEIETGLAVKKHSENELLSSFSAQQSNQQTIGDVEAIVVTGSRINPPRQQIPIDSDYLEDLVEKLQLLQVEANHETNQEAMENQQITQLQQDIFEYLMLLLTAEKHTLVEEKYLLLVTPEQRLQLTEKMQQ